MKKKPKRMEIKVLLVKDAIKNRSMIERILKNQGFSPEFLETDSVLKIDGILAQHHPDIVISIISEEIEVFFENKYVKSIIEQKTCLLSTMPSDN